MIPKERTLGDLKGDMGSRVFGALCLVGGKNSYLYKYTYLYSHMILGTFKIFKNLNIPLKIA